jgi:hypothetical protein
MKAISLLAWMAIVSAAASARAQAAAPTGGNYPPYVPPPYYGGSMYPVQTSTPLEGIAHGLGDVIRSIGDANLSNSAAAVNFSEARRREIENQKQWTETYFAMRDFNRQQRDAEIKRQRGNAEDWVRYAQAGKPKPLSNHDLDAVTGEIRWPILLNSQDFAAQRAELEKLFANRAYHGVMNAEDYLTAVRLGDEMSAGLKSRIQDVPPQQYMVARRFLESLTYEAGLPAG